MDKFGIFNLLNSFLNFYQQKKTESAPKPDKAEEGAFLANPFNNPPPTAKPKTAEEKKDFPPLQTMITTMRTHDRLVERVKSKHPTR